MQSDRAGCPKCGTNRFDPAKDMPHESDLHLICRNCGNRVIARVVSFDTINGNKRYLHGRSKGVTHDRRSSKTGSL